MSCVRACVRTCVCVCLCACMRMRVGSGSVLCGRQNFLRLTNWYKKILLFIAIFPSPHILSVHPAHGPFQSLLNESLLLLAVFYFSSFVCASATQKITNSFFFFTPERFQWKFIFGVFFFFIVLRVSPFCIIKRCSSNFKFIGESDFFPFMFDSKKCSAIKFIRAKQKKILLFYRFEISAICMLCIYVQSHKMEKKKTILANKILYNCA